MATCNLTTLVKTCLKTYIYICHYYLCIDLFVEVHAVYYIYIYIHKNAVYICILYIYIYVGILYCIYTYMGVYGIYGYITTAANNKLIFCHHQTVWFNQQKAHASEIPAIWIYFSGFLSTLVVTATLIKKHWVIYQYIYIYIFQ